MRKCRPAIQVNMNMEGKKGRRGRGMPWIGKSKSMTIKKFVSSHKCLFLHILGRQSSDPSVPNVPKAPDANPKPSLASSLNSNTSKEEAL
jgi:hypothetical protein